VDLDRLSTVLGQNGNLDDGDGAVLKRGHAQGRRWSEEHRLHASQGKIGEKDLSWPSISPAMPAVRFAANNGRAFALEMIRMQNRTQHLGLNSAGTPP